MKCLTVSSEYPPHIYGGLGVHVEKITASFGDNVDCELFVSKQGDYKSIYRNTNIHEINVPEAESELEYWLNFCKATSLDVEKNSIDVQLIHCHDWMTAFAGVKLRKLLKVPFVFNVHLPEITGYRYLLEKVALVAADLVIVNSESVKNELLSRKTPIRQIAVIPNGVDFNYFKPSINWPVDDGYILFVGRLVAQKGLDVLLEAFSIVLLKYPKSRLVIVGDGDLELYLKRFSRHRGISDKIMFTNWKTGHELVTLYQKAQMVVMPSYYEPFGIVALEAMACGKPLITTQTGGLQEIIENEVQGFLIPVNDHLILAKYISLLLNDPKRRNEMGAAARKRALDYGWINAANKTIQLYSELIKKSVTFNYEKEICQVSKELISESNYLFESAIDYLSK